MCTHCKLTSHYCKCNKLSLAFTPKVVLISDYVDEIFFFLFFQNLTKQSFDFFCLVLTLATFWSGKVKETPISAITVHTVCHEQSRAIVM